MTRRRRALEKLPTPLSEKSTKHAESVAQFYIAQIDAARVPHMSEYRIARLPVVVGQMAGRRAIACRIGLLDALDGQGRRRTLDLLFP